MFYRIQTETHQLICSADYFTGFYAIDAEYQERLSQASLLSLLLT